MTPKPARADVSINPFLARACDRSSADGARGLPLNTIACAALLIAIVLILAAANGVM